MPSEMMQAVCASFIKQAHADKLNKQIATISDMDPHDLVRESVRMQQGA